MFVAKTDPPSPSKSAPDLVPPTRIYNTYVKLTKVFAQDICIIQSLHAIYFVSPHKDVRPIKSRPLKEASSGESVALRVIVATAVVVDDWTMLLLVLTLLLWLGGVVDEVLMLVGATD